MLPVMIFGQEKTPPVVLFASNSYNSKAFLNTLFSTPFGQRHTLLLCEGNSKKEWKTE